VASPQLLEEQKAGNEKKGRRLPGSLATIGVFVSKMKGQEVRRARRKSCWLLSSEMTAESNSHESTLVGGKGSYS